MPGIGYIAELSISIPLQNIEIIILYTYADFNEVTKFYGNAILLAWLTEP